MLEKKKKLENGFAFIVLPDAYKKKKIYGKGGAYKTRRDHSHRHLSKP